MHRRTKAGFGNELLTDLSSQQAICYQTEVPGRSILLSSSPLPTNWDEWAFSELSLATWSH